MAAPLKGVEAENKGVINEEMSEWLARRSETKAGVKA